MNLTPNSNLCLIGVGFQKFMWSSATSKGYGPPPSKLNVLYDINLIISLQPPTYQRITIINNVNFSNNI